MYTVIVPTMWRFQEFSYTFLSIASHALVGQIIVINNDVKATPDWMKRVLQLNYPKLTVLSDDGKNIGVNPAWNLGVKQSKFDRICLLSDDVEFDVNIFNFLYDKLTPKDGLVGIQPNLFSRDGGIMIAPTEKMAFGYGSLMFLNKHNFKPIDENFKIFFGDAILFLESINQGKKPRIVSLPFCRTKVGTTSASSEFSEQTEHEKTRWQELYKIDQKSLFF